MFAISAIWSIISLSSFAWADLVSPVPVASAASRRREFTLLAISFTSDMAESLISTMAGDFDASAFTDDYREAMQALLEAKQTALDNGAPFPVRDEVVCERCRTVFETLDAACDLVRDLGRDELPQGVRERMLARLAAAE